MQQFKGTGVALVTPFKAGKPDLAALQLIIDHVLQGGVEYLVTLGTTGETVTLTSAEQRDIVDTTLDGVRGRVPLVAGCFGGNDTQALITAMRRFEFSGIQAVLSVSPAYNKPTQKGIIAHYTALADACPVPVIMYNVPSRTSSNMEAETSLALAEHDNILGIKEASANLVQCSLILKYRPADFLVISGDDPTALPLISCGGDGVISVIANAFPGDFSRLIRQALTGDFAGARALHLKYLDIHPLLYVEGNPAGIKGALEILGLCSREVRLPLLPLSQPNYDKLQRQIELLA